MRRSTLLSNPEEATGVRTDASLDIDNLAGQMGVDLATPKTLKEASHGEVVTLEDGTTGWVIDNDEVARKKMLEAGMDSIMKLASEQDTLFDTFAVDNSRKVDARSALLRSGGKNYNIGELINLQQQFAKYTYGPNGLVPVGDAQAADYQRKIDLLRSGKVRLPTVSEYERQVRELEESKKEGNTMSDMNQQIPQQPVPLQQPAPAPTPQAPVQPITREKVIDPNTPVVGVQPLPVAPKAPDPVPTPPPVIPTVQQVREIQPVAPAQPVAPMQQPPVAPQAPVQQVQPINMAKAMAIQKPTPQPQQPVPEEPKAPQITIQVPAEETPTFMATLPPELKEKVDNTAVLEVQSVVMTDVPVATRTIDTITDFKNIFPKKVVGNLVEKVLINSGYIATVEGASSLDMATIAYDPSTEVPDWPKMIQFAYDHLVGTSIGQLTFPKFVKETSAQDISVLIAAIYQASEPDVKSMMVQCGNPRCRDTHEISFSVSNMWDTSEFDEETIEYFNEIIAARDNIFQAREVHSRAPVMKIDYLRFDNMYFGVKHTDAETAGIYFPAAQELATNYNASVTIYVAFIKEVRIVENGATYASNSPEVICQSLLNIGNDEGQAAIRNYIIKNVKEYKTYRFKMKPLKDGDLFVCKKCGHTDESIDIQPETLVFRKASATGPF